MASRYDHYPLNFRREVLLSAGMAATIAERAGLVMAEAIRTAPVGDPNSGWYDHGNHPGEYKASFSLHSGAHADRVYTRVQNDSDHAWEVEFGFGRTPRYRTLGRALHAAGGDVKYVTP